MQRGRDAPQVASHNLCAVDDFFFFLFSFLGSGERAFGDRGAETPEFFNFQEALVIPEATEKKQ